jgi:hypothetical protein
MGHVKFKNLSTSCGRKNARFLNVTVGSIWRNCQALKGYTPNAVFIIVFVSVGDRSSK